jgi:molybdopterin molybdotransferase
MSKGGRSEGAGPEDVRLRGFADRASLAQALTWVDGRGAAPGVEEVPVEAAVGRVPAVPVEVPADVPDVDRAGEDGWAVRAGDAVGASAYDPVLLRAQPATEPLRSMGAALVAAGAALPQGADAVLGFDLAQGQGREVETLAAVAEGTGVARRGREMRAGARLAPAGRPLRPHDAAALAAAGVARVAVFARPCVRLVIAGPKAGPDAHAPMLRALVARDGGALDMAPPGDTLREAMARAAADPGADLLLVSGRTGTGPDDDAPLALASLGALELHGLALRPGGSAGLGVAGRVPAVLLPGDPVACLCAYELVAGRLVRRLGGRDAGLPHATREVALARKIASAVGFVEVCPVRLADGLADPAGVPDFGGLAAAARAEGFVVVPAALEGYAPGARVTVHLY